MNSIDDGLTIDYDFYDIFYDPLAFTILLGASYSSAFACNRIASTLALHILHEYIARRIAH